jgi:hypothetical protein
VRSEIQTLARELDDAVSTLERMSEYALGYLLDSMFFVRRPWPAEIFTVPRAIEAVRDLCNAAREAAKMELSELPQKGPRPDRAVYALIEQLCVIYASCTGQEPRRRTRSRQEHEEYGSEYGPFRDFVHVVFQPLDFEGDIEAYIQRTLRDRRIRSQARKFVERQVKGGSIAVTTLETMAAEEDIPPDFLRGALDTLGLRMTRIDGVLCYGPPDADRSD